MTSCPGLPKSGTVIAWQSYSLRPWPIRWQNPISLPGSNCERRKQEHGHLDVLALLPGTGLHSLHMELKYLWTQALPLFSWVALTKFLGLPVGLVS